MVKYEVEVETVKYGRKVTIISILEPELGRKERQALLRILKRRLGTGGYIDDDGRIVLRGDMRKRLECLLDEVMKSGIL